MLSNAQKPFNSHDAQARFVCKKQNANCQRKHDMKKAELWLTYARSTQIATSLHKLSQKLSQAEKMIKLQI